jgi:hypothetical protein
MLGIALANTEIHTIISHTYMFDGIHSGIVQSSLLIPSDIVISIVRIRFSHFVVINTAVLSKDHVFLITQSFLSKNMMW